jgi:hypothetical protein
MKTFPRLRWIELDMNADDALQKLDSLALEFSTDTFFRLVRKGDREMVDLFLDAGMSPDTRDVAGDAAVLVASRTGQTDIGRTLLARGASPEPLLITSPKGKDTWDKITASSAVLSFISSLLIAAVGGYFTYSYNQRQIDLNRTQAEHDSLTKGEGNKVLELEAIQKLIPLLTSSDEKGKAAALTAIQDLAHPALAADLAQLFKGPGSISYLTQAAASSNPGTKQGAVQALATIAVGGRGSDSQLASHALSTVFENARSSVVRIEASAPNEVARSGSGIIVSDRGDILTAAHVVTAPDPTNITVSTLGGRLFVGIVVKIDKGLDLAILRIKSTETFVPLHLGTDVPKPGAEVIGIGYSADVSDEAAFVGTVASIDAGSIYFTSAIGPGTSGGPLLDNAGEVVGLMHERRESLAIAVRGDIALRFLRNLQIQPGR